MDLWRESHPIPNPEVGFDITQLRVSQHSVEVADTDLGPILVLVLVVVVQGHCSPSSAQPGALNQPIITKLQLGQERVDFRLILKEEPKLLEILNLGGQRRLGHNGVQRKIQP